MADSAFQTLGFEEGLLIGISSEEVSKQIDSIFGPSLFQNLFSVVHAHDGIQEAFLVETGLKHVETVDFAPLK